MVSLAPRPPTGYSSLAVSPSQILLPLTISNKCGQAFRWHATDVYDLVDVKQEATTKVKQEDTQESTVKSEACSSTYTKSTEWSMCLSDRVVCVRQDEDRGFIYYKTILPDQHDPSSVTSDVVEEQTGQWLQDYLNIDVPLPSLYEEWSAKDAVFARFASRFSGVRMLRQDPWETLCAFICSSNNNIARIGQMVQNLCTHFSEPMTTITYPPPPRELYSQDEDVQAAPTTIVYYPFPPVEKLAHKEVEAKLRDLSFGYRARYIQETAQMLLDIVHDSEQAPSPSSTTPRLPYGSAYEYLGSLRKMSYAQAREQLIQFPGVGPKVADCILLMAMDQPSSIPVDRHVFQFAERWYGIRTKGGLKGYEKIADAFRQLWGPYAGWAHSVLFTADLRAFQTYNVSKKEEVKLEERLNGVKEEVADQSEFVDLYAQQPSTQVKVEVTENVVVEQLESSRTKRWKKRVYDQHVLTPKQEQEQDEQQQSLTKVFKDTKRSRLSTKGKANGI